MANINEYKGLREQIELISKCGIKNLNDINVDYISNDKKNLLIEFSRSLKKYNFESGIEGKILNNAIIMKYKSKSTIYRDNDDLTTLLEKKFFVYVGNGKKIIEYRFKSFTDMNEFYNNLIDHKGFNDEDYINKELKYNYR